MLLRQIRYFQAVVRYSSFTEAAEQCHISQSAISRQIRAPEDELGFDLLIRRSRSFELTPPDSIFTTAASPLSAMSENCARKAAALLWMRMPCCDWDI